LEKLEQQIKTRREEISKLIELLQQICIQLGTESKELFPELFQQQSFPEWAEQLGTKFVEDLSSERVIGFEKAIKNSNELLHQLQKKIRDLKAEIHSLWDELSMTTEERSALEIDKFAQTDQYFFSTTEKTHSMQQTASLLEARLGELIAAANRLKSAVKELMPKIVSLWSELQIPNIDPNYLKLWQVLELPNPSEKQKLQFLDDLQHKPRSTRFPVHVIEAVSRKHVTLIQSEISHPTHSHVFLTSSVNQNILVC
jgi:SPX domain protein involved in polyphosphate accumulation